MEFIAGHAETPRQTMGCEGETAATTLCHEFAELSDEFVQNLRRNLCGLFSTQVYDLMGQIHHEPMVTSSLFFAKLSGKSISHFCYMAVDLKKSHKKWKLWRRAGPSNTCLCYELPIHFLCSSLPIICYDHCNALFTCLNILQAMNCVLFITINPLAQRR